MVSGSTSSPNGSPMSTITMTSIILILIGCTLRGFTFDYSRQLFTNQLLSTPYPAIPIVFDLFWIIGFFLIEMVFGEYVKVYEMNENKNVNCEFGDLNYVFENENYGNWYELLHELLCPPLLPPPLSPTDKPISTPVPHPPAIEINYSRVLLREQLVLEYVFDIENGIVSNIIGVINNGFIKNFGDNGYGYFYPAPYPPRAPIPTPVIVFKFNGINTEIYKNNVLENVFGVDCYEYVFDNEIIYGELGTGREELAVGLEAVAVVTIMCSVCGLFGGFGSIFAPRIGVLQTIIGGFAALFAVLILSFSGLFGGFDRVLIRYKFVAKLAVYFPINNGLFEGLFGIHFIIVYGLVAAFLFSIGGLYSGFYGYCFAPTIGANTTHNDNFIGNDTAARNSAHTKRNSRLIGYTFAPATDIRYDNGCNNNKVLTGGATNDNDPGGAAIITIIGGLNE